MLQCSVYCTGGVLFTMVGCTHHTCPLVLPQLGPYSGAPARAAPDIAPPSGAATRIYAQSYTQAHNPCSCSHAADRPALCPLDYTHALFGKAARI